MLRLTLLDPSRGGAAADVAVRTAPGTPLHIVRDGLCAAAGSPPAALFCAGRELPPDAALGLPPLVDGAVLSVGAPTAAPAPALLEAHVVAGPDAGAVLPLPPGGWTVGRASGAAVRIADPDLSRVHALLRVEGAGVSVSDAGSTNGTWVDGSAVGTEPVALAPAAVVRIGSSSLRVRAPDGMPAAVRADGTGGVVVNRPPRFVEPSAAVEVRRPDPPPGRRPVNLPWPALVLPALLSVPLALIWRQPSFLLLALMSPLLGLGQFIADRRGGRRDAREAAARHTEACARADARIAAAVDVDAARREAAAPDLALLGAVARGPTDRLWERRPGDEDALTLRIGRGALPSRVLVGGPGDDGPVTEVPEHADVPVTVDLRAAPVLGIAGPRAESLGLARALVGQLAVLRSPRDVRIDVLGPDADWAWTAWLPHRHDRLGGIRVVVLDGAQRLRQRSDVAALLAGATAGSDVVICLEEDPGRLPVECRATVSPAGPGVVALRADGQPVVNGVRPDLAGARWANRVARALAPLRDPEPAARLPVAVRLFELVARVLSVDAGDPAALTRLWSAAQDGPAAGLIGMGADGPRTVHLPRDGPHALIAGTTGAGKSELLQTLVAGLAIANPPDAVCFLLVDYKGGTSFGECAGLPHVAGLVTDLDAHLARRALASLAAELRRREELLRRAGAADVAGYAGLRTATGLPPMPRLVVVVDEFRVLAEELPEFVTGLVRTATLGRSLGVHLVLATQRPAGVVSAEIRANAGLRIALRVQDRADSDDVVGCPDAAALPAAVPGRAVFRSAGADAEVLQVARVAGGRGEEALPPVVLLDARLRPAEDPPADGGPTDLSRLVAAARTAAAGLGIDPPTAPWCPPLPADLAAGDLSRLPPPPAPGLVIGLTDEPERQRQVAATWAEGTHLAVAGGPRSGRSTALTAAARAAGAAGMHVYAIDGGGALARLADDPCVGAVIPAADHERCGRLLRRLSAEIARGEGGPGGVVLLVDGWEAVVEAWADVEHGRLVDDLLRVLRDGPGAGLRAAVAGGRAVLTGPPSAHLAQRLVLRFADPHDAVLAGVAAAAIPAHQPPGRGLLVTSAGSPVEVQVVRPAPAANTHRPGRPPWRVPALPAVVRADALPPPDGLAVAMEGAVAIGAAVEGDAIVAAALPLDRPGVVAALGPAGSGRTTALATIARAAAAAGFTPVLVSASLDHLARANAVDPWDPAAVSRLEALTGSGRVVLLVDDAADVPGHVAEVLAAHCARAPVVVAAGAGQVVAAYGGLLGAARGARTGLLLGAVAAGDGEALGVRLGPAPAGPAGRGWLVVRGRARAVQVAQ